MSVGTAGRLERRVAIEDPVAVEEYRPPWGGRSRSGHANLPARSISHDGGERGPGTRRVDVRRLAPA